MNKRFLKAIYGGPGSGKTNCLIELILGDISHPDDVSNYGMVTFTKAGAREARQRVQHKLGLNDESTLIYFKTVHAMCYALLGLKDGSVANAGERIVFAASKGMKLTNTRDYDINDMETYMLDMEFKTPGDILFGIYDWCSARNIDPVTEYTKCPVMRYARSRFTQETVKEFVEGWDRFKTGEWKGFPSLEREWSERLYDFHDMLREVLANGLAPMVKKWYWDEFQDNYPLLFQIYQMWTTKPWVEHVVIAGDPNQTIYTFAGADPSFFMGQLKAADETVPLTESHRCAEKIMVFANMLLESIPEEQRVQWVMHTKKPGGIVEEIDYGEVTDMANVHAMAGDSVYILCRTNRQVSEIERKLSLSGVPNTWLKQESYGGGSVWTKSVPKFMDAVGTFMKEDVMGVGQLKDLIGPMNAGRNPEDGIVKHGEKAKLIAGKYAKGGVMLTSDLMDYLWPVTKEDVVNRLMNILREPKASEKYHGVALEKAMERPENGGWGGYILPFDAHNISIGTMHSGKGKEADVEISITKMPRPSADAMLHDHSVIYDEIRLNYVASTRARKALYIVNPDEVGAVARALRHLKSIEGKGDVWKYVT